MSVQAPSAVVLIRPHHFAPNSETADDNVFQTIDAGRPAMIHTVRGAGYVLKPAVG